MGWYCVAAGCTNSNKSGASVFRFPKDPQLGKEWESQVHGGQETAGVVLLSLQESVAATLSQNALKYSQIYLRALAWAVRKQN